MNTCTLIFGLGETGSRIVGELARMRRAQPQNVSRTELLALDDSELVLNELPDLEFGERIALDGRAARERLASAQPNDPRFGWLGFGERRDIADEIQAERAGKQRWLGRLAFSASATSIAQAIRHAAQRARLKSNGPGAPLTAVIVSSASGGTGSGSWLDLSYLTQLLVEPERLFAVLLLPAEGSLGSPEISANAYACLREAYHLKYEQLGFEAAWDDQLRIERPGAGGEVWHRLYLHRPLFATEEGYSEAIRQVALFLQAQQLPELAREIDRETAGDLRLLEGGELDPGRRERPFSTGATARVFLPADEDGASEADVQQEASIEPRTLGGGASLTAPGTQLGSPPADPSMLVVVSPLEARVLAAVTEARASLLEVLRKSLDETRERVGEEDTDSLMESHRELLSLEQGFRLQGETAVGSSPNNEPWWNIYRSASEIPQNLSFKVEVQDWARARIDIGRTSDRLRTTVVELQVGSGPTAESLLALRSRIPQLVQQPPLLPALEKSRAEMRALAGEWWASIRNGLDLFRRWRNNEPEPPGTQGLLAKLKRLWWRFPGRPGKKLDRIENLRLRCDQLVVLLDQAPMLRAIDTFLFETLLAQVTPAPFHPDRPSPISERLLTAQVPEPGSALPPKDRLRLFHDELTAALARCRSRVFVPEGAAPETHSYALATVPPAWLAESGEKLRARVLQTVHDELGCTCRIVAGPEGAVWIYHESLFHSPCEIRNLPSWRQAYEKHSHRERLHVDVRWLSNPKFTDLCPDRPLVSAFCGNSRCSENIAALSHKERRCPGCSMPIRSRCGNPDCNSENLHHHPRGQALNCPDCGEFNHAAWWRCRRHGKLEVAVPIDKSRCLECIRLYQADPILYPAEYIGHNPLIEKGASCPNCDRLAELDPTYEPWQIPERLRPFVEDGVNGHELAPFLEEAERWRLPETVRCPKCRTLLVPVHHRRMATPSEQPLSTLS